MEGQRFYEAIYFLATLDPDYFIYQPYFLEFIFPSVFIFTIIVSAVVCALYYNVVNNITGRLGYLLYWFIFMIVNGGLCFYLAVNKAANVIFIDLAIEKVGWIFGFNNFLLSLIFFFIFSMVLKWKKITMHADHLPFKTPW